MTLSTDDIEQINGLTESFLKTLVEFKATFDLSKYIHDQKQSDWRNLDAELSVNYPIKGTGIWAKRNKLDDFYHDYLDNDGFIHDEEPLNPSEAIPHLGDFPLQEASAAYIFTLLEGYGNNVVKIVNPAYLTPRKAWHNKVFGDTNLSDTSELDNAQRGFALPFSVDKSVIPVSAVEWLVDIKKKRNAFMHEGTGWFTFSSVFERCVGLACVIHFICVPTATELKVYPWEDYEGKWV